MGALRGDCGICAFMSIHSNGIDRLYEDTCMDHGSERYCTIVS